MEPIYESLPPERIKQITDTIDVGYDLVAITLVSDDILIGGLENHWSWNNENVCVSFNTKFGKTFGSFHTVLIPLNLIANITLIPLAEESIPHFPEDEIYVKVTRKLGLGDDSPIKYYVQDYPNPLATIIAEHNLAIALAKNLEVDEALKHSLSSEAIPPNGILFEKDFILYADWNYFSHQMHGATSLSASAGVVGVTKDFSPSQQSFVFGHLSQNFQKIKNIQDVVVQTGVDEIFARGCILSPQPPQDTEIEGEKCILLACGNAQDTGEAVYPVLVKQKAFKYPLEFVGQIRSQLVFYGEFLPVPLEVFGRKQQYTILARAIGYLRH